MISEGGGGGEKTLEDISKKKVVFFQKVNNTFITVLKFIVYNSDVVKRFDEFVVSIFLNK